MAWGGLINNIVKLFQLNLATAYFELILHEIEESSLINLQTHVHVCNLGETTMS